MSRALALAVLLAFSQAERASMGMEERPRTLADELRWVTTDLASIEAPWPWRTNDVSGESQVARLSAALLPVAMSRFLTLTNVHNEARDVSPYLAEIERLFASRGAGGKLARSAGDCLVRINLSDLEWPSEAWDLVTESYPFQIGSLERPSLQAALLAMTGRACPHIRADWFLIRLSDAEVQARLRELGVDVEYDVPRELSERYFGPVSLAGAAAELGLPPGELRARVSDCAHDMGGLLASLDAGTLAREQFNGQFGKLAECSQIGQRPANSLTGESRPKTRVTTDLIRYQEEITKLREERSLLEKEVQRLRAELEQLRGH